MTMLFVVVAGLCLAGLLPATIASRKGRSFGFWWLYGAVLFPVALVHAVRVGEDEGERRVPDGQIQCPGCGEAIPEAARSCRYCGEVIATPTAAAGTAAANDPPADWDEGFASLVQEPPPPPPQPEGRSRHAGAAAIVAASAAAAVGFFAIGFVILNGAELLSVAEAPERERSIAGRIGGIEPSAGPSGGASEGRSRPEQDVLRPVVPHPEGAPAPDPQGAPAPQGAPVPAAPGTTAGEGGESRPPLVLETARPVEEVPGEAPDNAAENASRQDPTDARGEPPQAGGEPSLPPERQPERSGGTGAVTAERLPPATRSQAEIGPAPPPRPPAAEIPREERETTRREERETTRREERDTEASAPPTPAHRRAPASAEDDEVTAVGDLVLWVQRELFRRGFYNGTINGRAGRKTREAVRAYQRSQDLLPSGEIDPVLVTSLRRSASAGPREGMGERPPWESRGERQLTQD